MKVPLSNIGSGYASTDLLNDNFDDIETGFENTLSRDGTSPNQMETDFDMNSFRIINLADPINEVDAVNLRTLKNLPKYFEFKVLTDNYTLLQEDTGTILVVTASTDKTITVPDGLNVGTFFSVIQAGAGQITISMSGAEALVKAAPFVNKTRTQYSLISASKTGVVGLEWLLHGDLYDSVS